MFGLYGFAKADAQTTLPTDKIPANIKNIQLLREAYHSVRGSTRFSEALQTESRIAPVEADQRHLDAAGKFASPDACLICSDED